MLNLWERRQQSSNNWLGNSSDQIQSTQSPIVNDQIKNIYQMYMASKDKKGFLNKLISSNPSFSGLLGEGNLKDKFYNECKRRGINPEQYISQLKNSLK